MVGLFGPRPGNSSGIFPGSSCGRAGSPGSCIGGGISGRGLPGGSSRGGSVGWPGVGAGISGGSIGIVSLFLPQGDNEGYDAFVPLIDSGISLYVWTGPQFLSVVTFTCKAFDAERAVDVTREFFAMTRLESAAF